MEEVEIPLDAEVRKFRQAAFSDNTKSTYRCQLKKYLDFCTYYGYQPVPASSQTICRYIAFLAQSMRPGSIKQYLNVIRLLHLESGFSNPLQEDFTIHSVMKGVQRVKGDFVKRKLPITPDILMSFIPHLNLQESQCAAFWAATLVAFYGMLRKSSLFASNAPHDHMCLQNCAVHDWGIEITVNHSKTIQFQERRAYIALPWNTKNEQLCPVSALLKSLSLSHCCQANDYLFTFIRNKKQHRMTYSLFTTMLRNMLSCLKLPLDQYSGHSLRRGGATQALKCGIPSEIIQAQGDWKSLAYLDYIDKSSSHDRAKVMENIYS